MLLRPRVLVCLLALPALLVAQSAPMPAIRGELDRLYPGLEAFYLDLHRHPELSGVEVKTAAKMADQWRQAGFAVTTGVGGTGVVGVLKNGQGPTLLLRTELDALPLQEKTGLPYASLVPGIMHACGHDLHMTGLAGAAAVLSRLRGRWRGTLVLVAQPAEETVGGNDGTRVGLWLQPLEGPARRLDLGNVDPAWSFAVDVTVAGTGALAFVGRTPQHPSELYVMGGPAAKPRRLTNFNAAFDGLDLGRVVRVTWKGPEGQVEDGVLTFPPNAPPGRKLPLVLVIHGGPTAASGEAFNLRNQLLAAEGFLVFNPNYRGSDNLGDAYAHSILNDAGEGPGRDVMAGIEALKARGLVDATRMAVTGWSYGGYMTSWLLGRYPDVWRAGVAGAPVTDLHDEYALSDNNQAWRLGFWEGIDAYDGAKGEAAFRAQSPLSLARHIKAPTLILTMNQDFRVPAAQSYKLYRVLKDSGREVKFYAWPQRGHGPATPARQRQVNQLWTDWLTTHLK